MPTVPWPSAPSSAKKCTSRWLCSGLEYTCGLPVCQNGVARSPVCTSVCACEGIVPSGLVCGRDVGSGQTQLWAHAAVLGAAAGCVSLGP